MAFLIRHWRWMPYLDFLLNLHPLFLVEVRLHRLCHDQMARDDIVMSVMLFTRWGFSFRLYSPYLREKSNIPWCSTCGGECVYIRGRHPGNDKRKVCPTCLQEKIEDMQTPTMGEQTETVED